MHRLEGFKNSITPLSEFTREWFNLARTSGSAMEHDSTRGGVTVLAKILPGLVHSLIVIRATWSCQIERDDQFQNNEADLRS
jgi:hypothetical protein